MLKHRGQEKVMYASEKCAFLSINHETHFCTGRAHFHWIIGDDSEGNGIIQQTCIYFIMAIKTAILAKRNICFYLNVVMLLVLPSGCWCSISIPVLSHAKFCDGSVWRNRIVRPRRIISRAMPKYARKDLRVPSISVFYDSVRNRWLFFIQSSVRFRNKQEVAVSTLPYDNSTDKTLQQRRRTVQCPVLLPDWIKIWLLWTVFRAWTVSSIQTHHYNK